MVIRVPRYKCIVMYNSYGHPRSKLYISRSLNIGNPSHPEAIGHLDNYMVKNLKSPISKSLETLREKVV